MHVSQHFQNEMSSEWHYKHIQFYPKQMNVNLETFYYIGCCSIEIVIEWW